MRPARTAVCLLVALAAGLPARAVRAESEVPLTALEAGPLGRSRLVVLGELGEVRATRGPAIAQVRPLRALKGEVPAGGPLLVLVGGPRPASDPRAPSAPYLEPGAAGRFVFFLAGEPDAGVWRLVTLVDAGGELGAEKVAALERHAALAALADPGRRAAETLAWLLEAQAARGTWTRVHAARELNHLAGARPDLFDASAVERVRRAARRAAVPAQRAWLETLLQALGRAPAAPGASGPPAPPEGLEARLAGLSDAAARLDALRAWLDAGGSPRSVLARLPAQPTAVRLGVIETLVEGRWPDVLPALLALYAREDEPEVARALVRAAGLLGGAAEVAWLEARLANPRVRREALFALARIRTPEALAALARAREQGGAAGDSAALIDYLRGPAFEEVEAAAGRGR